MKRSFFAFMDAAELTLIRNYPEHTDVFERAADECETLFNYTLSDPKHSELLVQSLFRINLNYLIGAYKATLQAIPSFAYCGMRNIFEGTVRGYYYLVNEEAAIASYLYMSTHGAENAPGFDDVDVNIMKGAIDQVQDAKLKQLCEKVLKKEGFSEDDKAAVSKLDESSRKIKHNIGKLYTSRVQTNMNAIWSEFSRYCHSGFRLRYEDLQLPKSRIPVYESHLTSLLLLLTANALMYLEIVDHTKIDASFLGEVFRLIEYYPEYFPNKDKYQGCFKLTSQQAIDRLLRI
jgi:hypothetical protein